MALATLDDVKRVLQETGTTHDAALAEFLETAESWVRRRLRRSFDLSTQQTLKEFSVREDGLIDLPEEGSTVQEVKVFYYGGSSDTGRVLDTDEWLLVEGRQVRLIPSLIVTPFEGAAGRRLADWYNRVEVKYTPPGIVPQAVRDATAILAASLFRDAGPTVGTIKKESIGDYSYELDIDNDGAGGTDEQGVPKKVRTLLAPWMRHRVSVV